MTRKRLLGVLAFGLLFAVSLLWKSPEGRLASQLGEIASALSYARDESASARDQRFRDALGGWLDGSSEIHITGAGAFTGSEGALHGLQQLTSKRPQAYFELERIEVTLEGDRASAVGLLNVSETQVSDLHRDQRRVDIRLSKAASGWTVRTLRIGEADNTQPWERP